MKKIIEGKISGDKRVKVRLRMHRNKGPEFMVEGRLMERSPKINECKDICPFHPNDYTTCFDPVCLDIRDWFYSSLLVKGEKFDGEVLPIKKEKCKSR